MKTLEELKSIIAEDIEAVYYSGGQLSSSERGIANVWINGTKFNVQLIVTEQEEDFIETEGLVNFKLDNNSNLTER